MLCNKQVDSMLERYYLSALTILSRKDSRNPRKELRYLFNHLEKLINSRDDYRNNQANLPIIPKESQDRKDSTLKPRLFLNRFFHNFLNIGIISHDIIHNSIAISGDDIHLPFFASSLFRNIQMFERLNIQFRTSENIITVIIEDKPRLIEHENNFHVINFATLIRNQVKFFITQFFLIIHGHFYSQLFQYGELYGIIILQFSQFHAKSSHLGKEHSSDQSNDKHQKHTRILIHYMSPQKNGRYCNLETCNPKKSILNYIIIILSTSNKFVHRYYINTSIEVEIFSNTVVHIIIIPQTHIFFKI